MRYIERMSHIRYVRHGSTRLPVGDVTRGVVLLHRGSTGGPQRVVRIRIGMGGRARGMLRVIIILRVGTVSALVPAVLVRVVWLRIVRLGVVRLGVVRLGVVRLCVVRLLVVRLGVGRVVDPSSEVHVHGLRVAVLVHDREAIVHRAIGVCVRRGVGRDRGVVQILAPARTTNEAHVRRAARAVVALMRRVLLKVRHVLLVLQLRRATLRIDEGDDDSTDCDHADNGEGGGNGALVVEEVAG